MNASVFIVFLSFIFFILPAQPAFPRLPPPPPSGTTIATSTYLEGEVCSQCFAEGQNSQSPDCRSCYSPRAQCVSLWPGVDIKGDRCETYTLVCKVKPQHSRAGRESPRPQAHGCFLSSLPVPRAMPAVTKWRKRRQASQADRVEAEGTGSVRGSPQSCFK